jgi:peptide/nickel transport system substrate-binding protein
LKDTHRHKSWLRLLALLLGLMLVAAACGDDSDTAGDGGDDSTDEATDEGTDGDEPERNPVEGGELVFAAEADVQNLSPGQAIQPTDRVIALGIYDPLTTWIDGKLEPYLAESFESNDALDEWTVVLREGVLFHDDTPLNADAVVKHFLRLQDPATACPCKSEADNIESMDTPEGAEGLTVVFHLKTPDVAFGDYLAGSSGFIESPTAAASGLNFAQNGVGTGPFKFQEYKSGEHTVLVKWPKYWQKDENGIQLPYLDKFTVKPIADAGQRVTALETGEIDMFQTAASDTVVDAEERGFAAQKISGSSSTILLFNTSKPPFDDVRARQAVAYAIDKDLINERAYGGIREPSYSGFAPDSAYFNPDALAPKYDPEKARELVDELGGLDFTLTCIPTPESEEILNIVKAQEQAAYVTRIVSKGGDYEAGCFRSSHFIEPDAIRDGLTTDNNANYVFYSNEEVDRLLDEGRQTAVFEERKEIYDEVQEILAEEVPLITTLYDLFGNVYDATRAGPPPPGEANSLGAIKPGFLYAVGG